LIGNTTFFFGAVLLFLKFDLGVTLRVGLSPLAFFIPLCSIKKSSNKGSIPYASFQTNTFLGLIYLASKTQISAL